MGRWKLGGCVGEEGARAFALIFPGHSLLIAAGGRRLGQDNAAWVMKCLLEAAPQGEPTAPPRCTSKSSARSRKSSQTIRPLPGASHSGLKMSPLAAFQNQGANLPFQGARTWLHLANAVPKWQWLSRQESTRSPLPVLVPGGAGCIISAPAMLLFHCLYLKRPL